MYGEVKFICCFSDFLDNFEGSISLVIEFLEGWSVVIFCLQAKPCLLVCILEAVSIWNCSRSSFGSTDRCNVDSVSSHIFDISCVNLSADCFLLCGCCTFVQVMSIGSEEWWISQWMSILCHCRRIQHKRAISANLSVYDWFDRWRYCLIPGSFVQFVHQSEDEILWRD